MKYDTKGARDRSAGPGEPGGRRTMPAGRVLSVILICLLVWGFLYAPTMKRAAEASREGLRRRISLDLLTPLAGIGSFLQITRATDAVESALGRDPNAAPGGTIVIPDIPLPTIPGGAVQTPSASGPIRKPTPNNKLRVVVIGDSLASGLGLYAERIFKPGLVRASNQGRISTGLSRPDYFDWPANMQKIVNQFSPDLVIVMLGENDGQSLTNAQGHIVAPISTPAWPPAYAGRVAQLAKIATSGGARLVWVGLPIVKDPGRRAVGEHLNGVYEEALSSVENTAYLDIWDLFKAPDGGYTAYFHSGGRVTLVRAPDGLHFNSTGYEMVAAAAAGLAERRFGLDPKTLVTP